MTATANTLKRELIEQAVERLRAKLDPAQVAPAEAFLRRYYAQVAPDDVLAMTPEDLLGSVLSLWSFLRQRPTGQTRLRLYNPVFEEHGWRSDHTVLEVVQDDKPFLVDSVTAVLQGRDLHVHLAVHPVLPVRRDDEGRLVEIPPHEAAAAGELPRESVMHLEFDHVTEPRLLADIRQQVEDVLADVHLAVADWRAMRQRVEVALDEWRQVPPPVDDEQLAEVRDFLLWLQDDHFTFLGYRYATLDRGGEDERERWALRADESTALGILRRPGKGAAQRPVMPLTPKMKRFAESSEPVIVTKADSIATVHRPVPLDYVGVKRFDERGEVVGEHRFLGLLTSAAYSSSARRIPLLRQKVRHTLERAGFAPDGHAGKALVHILETFPRDELFQISEGELEAVSLGILQLQERQRTALFVREDPFDRYVSCLVFLPRERISTSLRLSIQDVLERAFDGRLEAFYLQVGDSLLARLHFIIRTRPGQLPSYDVKTIEAHLATVARSWADRLRDVLVAQRGEREGLALLRRYGDAFPTAYRETFGPEAAVADVERLEEAVASKALRLNLYRTAETPEQRAGFKLYRPGKPLPLSDVLPKLEKMGLKVLGEIPYEVRLADTGESVWIGDFELEATDGKPIDVTGRRQDFQAAFERIWHGEIESDSFNRLVLATGLDWRQVVMLRAYGKYMKQAGVTFSPRYLAQTLARNPQLARRLVGLFEARFDPDLAEQLAPEELAARRQQLEAEIRRGLDDVKSLDEDRIVRHFLILVLATVRTNFYQRRRGDGSVSPEPKSYVSFKLDCRLVPDLPEPKPLYEIFVYSPRFEAVHLRGGRVARGGLRWSDRREDFRTEVLGLMKAQMVKNAVIVPVGAKGGFVLKRTPADRNRLLQEVQACYQDMIRGLLDVTDNLRGGQVVPPPEVVRHDGDDPYLVVAADKGTAKFSDLANAVSAEYGFWLGDAFASGGSAGYDHKAMAITSRGAWESVKRSFRELGVDVQSQPFTAVGVGDMSGDVFGNGMLRSPFTRLVGAFDHRHVFVDPDPDPARSFAERQRLFDLPGSSWRDYDPALLSPGGAVFDRSEKSLELSPEIRARLDVDAERLAPNELIRALLRAPVDLLWLGGIGTYVKAADERDAEVSDRTNDGVRVVASDLRCRVVGEGANLGITQRGRVKLAARPPAGRGIKVYTDFIDNSGGVDCSDHEVNIKILLEEVVTAGDLTLEQRDQLLEEMTDEVAALVLRDNYLQTQAISVEEARGPAMLHEQMRMIRRLERQGRLSRALEALPDDETLEERQAEDRGLTRPEICVLLAYAKLDLYEALLEGDLPDDPLLEEDLVRYFPNPLRERFPDSIRRHRLRREIIATYITNSMVNRVGPTFVQRLEAETGRPASDVARAYSVVRDAYDLRGLWAEIESLDELAPVPVGPERTLPAQLQARMILEAGRLVERVTLWMLRNGRRPIHMSAAAGDLGMAVRALNEALEEILPPEQQAALARRIADWQVQGAPPLLARHVASLEPLAFACDIVRIGEGVAGAPALWQVGRVYYAVGARFELDHLVQLASRLPAASRWQRDAVEALLEDFYSHQRDLTVRVLDEAGDPAAGGAAPAGDPLEAWTRSHGDELARYHEQLEDLRESETVDFAMLSVLNHQLRRLARGGK